MNKNFTQSMFESIKNSLENQKASGNFKDILKTDTGNTYVVRLVPYIKDPKRTIYHYYSHGWNSRITGQFISAICPTTWGERCPICEHRIKLYREGSESAKKDAQELKRNEKWLVNVYVVKNPKNTADEGTIKILRYGKQLDKIIHEAVEGEDAEEFGAKIFDLTKEGCSLRIKVEKNEGGYPSYVSSKFLSSSEIDGLTEAKINEIYNKVFDLDGMDEHKSYETLQETFNDHFTGKKTSESEVKTESQPTTDTEESLSSETPSVAKGNKLDLPDDLPGEDDTNTEDDDKRTQSKIDDILKELE